MLITTYFSTMTFLQTDYPKIYADFLYVSGYENVMYCQSEKYKGNKLCVCLEMNTLTPLSFSAWVLENRELSYPSNKYIGLHVHILGEKWNQPVLSIISLGNERLEGLMPEMKMEGLHLLHWPRES